MEFSMSSALSATYFINPSHPSVYLYAYPLWSLLPKASVRQRLAKHVPAARNAGNSRKTVGSVCLWMFVLLGTDTVKTFSRHRRIGGVVSYVVRVAWKEMQLVPTKTRCFYRKLLIQKQLYVDLLKLNLSVPRTSHGCPFYVCIRTEHSLMLLFTKERPLLLLTYSGPLKSLKQSWSPG